MNLKTIITIAGLALLSGLAASAQDNCGFVSATQVADHCWSRLDSCGNYTLIGSGCIYTYGKPAKGKDHSSICPNKVAPALPPPFVPVSLKGAETE